MDGPGPGQYPLASTLGSGPGTPLLRFSGAYSFPRRTKRLPELEPKASNAVPSPQDYKEQTGWALTAPSKPSWAFGTERRAASDVTATDSYGRGVPGPGQYTPASPRREISAICTPRRPLRVHPLVKSGFDPGATCGTRAHSGDRGLLTR